MGKRKGIVTEKAIKFYDFEVSVTVKVTSNGESKEVKLKANPVVLDQYFERELPEFAERFEFCLLPQKINQLLCDLVRTDQRRLRVLIADQFYGVLTSEKQGKHAGIFDKLDDKYKVINFFDDKNAFLLYDHETKYEVTFSLEDLK